MKLSNTAQLKLIERVTEVRKAWGDKGSYVKAYQAAFGKRKHSEITIMNVWNLKALSTNVDIIENLEKLVKS